MSSNFFKYPTTPHLTLIGNVTVRGDKVMSRDERDAFLQHPLVVEEKIDGANLGISFDAEGNIRAQNRGAYLHLPGSGQWKKLSEWLSPRTDALFDGLGERFILFGEWCYAKHSVFYDSLPDWFLGFDLYDRREARFLGHERRDDLLQAIDVVPVQTLATGGFTLEELTSLLAKSRYGNAPAEGLYLRVEQGGWLLERAKLVRPAFLQSMAQHWSRQTIKPNSLRMAVQKNNSATQQNPTKP